MTERLYFDDPFLTDWSATVVRADPAGGGFDVVLDRTAFYPAGGGQPCDLGWIGSARVEDVLEEKGEVRHRVRATDGACPAGAVSCRIDGTRRWDHLQQHHGQHILSAAFRAVADVETVSFHLGPEVSTIDLAAPGVSGETVRRAETMANEVVQSNREVRSRVFPPEEARRLHLRKLPVMTGPVRIIEIDGFDWTPCGGTHPSRTGAVGLIAVIGTEHPRGVTRVTFVCGRRAQIFFASRVDLVDRLSHLLKAPDAELPDRVGRLQEEVRRLRKEAARLREEADGAAADALLKSALDVGGVLVIHGVQKGRDLQGLAHLASRLVRKGSGPDVVALLGADCGQSAGVGAMNDPGRAALVFARSTGPRLKAVDLRDPHREACALVGGKGGGSAHLVQGAGPNADRLVEAIQVAFTRFSALIECENNKRQRTNDIQTSNEKLQ